MSKSWIVIAVLAIVGAVAFLMPRETPPESEEVAPEPTSFEPVEVDRIDELRIMKYEGSGSTLRQVDTVLVK